MICWLSRFPARVAAFVGLALTCGSISTGQSLGEIARREEARRKSVKTTSPVYTNADLENRPAPTPPPSDTSSLAAAEGGKPEAPGKVESAPPTDEPPGSRGPVKDEASWRERMAVARAEIDRSRTYLDALQSRINALTTDFVNRDDPVQRALIETDRNKALAELDRLQGLVQQQLKAVADIEEEARRAGVPPGWLR